MINSEKTLLEDRLMTLFPRLFSRLVERWELSDWSKIYAAEFSDDKVLYVKGTPRSRFEASVTTKLHSYCPDRIPRVLDDDLLPENQWRWFLLENVGKCNHDHIPPECASRAAYSLGRLQNTICNDRQLAQYLPQCRADCLQEVVLCVCDWMLKMASEEECEEIMSLQKNINSSTDYFREIENKVADLPSTCVHGDFWSGNIACSEGKVIFIDWGDALWGIGSISIVNLLATEGGVLSGNEGKIWEAYSRGWEREITGEFISGSRIAASIGNLMVDMEIAKCCGGTIEMLPGLIPTLRELAKELS